MCGVGVWGVGVWGVGGWVVGGGDAVQCVLHDIVGLHTDGSYLITL